MTIDQQIAKEHILFETRAKLLPIIENPYVTNDFKPYEIQGMTLRSNVQSATNPHCTVAYFDENLICRELSFYRNEPRNECLPFYTLKPLRVNNEDYNTVSIINDTATDRHCLLIAGNKLQPGQDFNDFIKLYNNVLIQEGAERAAKQKAKMRQMYETGELPFHMRTKLTNLMLSLNMPYEIFWFISNVERPGIYRDPENFKKKTFDYITVDLRTRKMSFAKKKAFFKRHAKDIIRLCLGKIEKTYTFKQCNVPVNFLRVTEYTFTQDDQLIITFELKNLPLNNPPEKEQYDE